MPSKKTTKSAFDKTSDVTRQYTKQTKSHDRRFGDYVVLTNNAKESVMQKTKTSNSEKEAMNDVQQAKTRLSMNHPHLQTMIDYSETYKSDFCSKFWQTNGFYEYPRRYLASDKDDRMKDLDAKRLNDQQMIYMVYQINSALVHLHQHNNYYNDVRPYNVAIRDDLNFFLVDRMTNNTSADVSAQQNFVNRRDNYCSPQVWAVAGKSTSKSNKNVNQSARAHFSPAKNDAWALGMTTLQSGLGKDRCVQDCYEKGGVFNSQRLRNHLTAFRDRYTENNLLCECVEYLLEEQEDARFSCESLQSKIPDYNEIVEHYRGGHTEVVHHEPVREHVHVEPSHHHHVVNHGDHSHVVTHHDHAHVVHREPVVHREHVHHVEPVVHREHVHHVEPVVHREHVHVEPVVHREPVVVHREPVVRRVSHREHVHVEQPVHHHVVNHGDHSHVVTHKEPVVRRVSHREHVHHVEPVRVSHAHRVVNEPRRVSHVHHVEPTRVSHAHREVVSSHPTVVRRDPVVTTHGHTHTNNVVRVSHSNRAHVGHSHVVGGHSHVVGGHSHVVGGHSHVVGGHSHVVPTKTNTTVVKPTTTNTVVNEVQQRVSEGVRVSEGARKVSEVVQRESQQVNHD